MDFLRLEPSGKFQLWKKYADGSGAEIQITEQGAFESFAAPNRRWIYYSKGRGLAGLWRVSTDGEGESAIPELATAGFWRYWTVTPLGIYYVAYAAHPPYRIMFYDFPTARTKEILTTDEAPLWNFPGLSVGAANDGSFLYTQADQDFSSITLAELSARGE